MMDIILIGIYNGHYVLCLRMITCLSRTKIAKEKKSKNTISNYLILYYI